MAAQSRRREAETTLKSQLGSFADRWWQRNLEVVEASSALLGRRSSILQQGGAEMGEAELVSAAMQKRSRKQLAAAVLAMLALSACQHTAGAQETTTVAGPDVETRLVMINTANAKAERELGQDLFGNYVEQESKVFEACGFDPNAELAPLVAGALATVAGYVIGEAIDFFVREIENSLKKELEKYTATYGAASVFDFYDAQRSRVSGEPTLQFSCFRLTRRIGQKVAFDFVGGFRILNQEVLELRPLRLYVAEPDAESIEDNGKKKYGLSVVLKADAIWRQDNSGRSAKDVLNHTVLKESFSLPDDEGNASFYRSYVGDRSKRIKAPLVPWSAYGENEYGGNSTSMRVSVAEVGNAPWLLEKGLALFKGVSGDISKQLKDAATAAFKKNLGANN